MKANDLTDEPSRRRRLIVVVPRLIVGSAIGFGFTFLGWSFGCDPAPGPSLALSWLGGFLLASVFWFGLVTLGGPRPLE